MTYLKIAVCDDEEKMLHLLSSTIKSAFEKHDVIVSVDTYSSARMFSDFVKREMYDIIFLDIQMPGADGVNLGEKIRKSNDKVEIVFVSAREDRVFDTFKIKPFSFVRKSCFLSDLSAMAERYVAVKLGEVGNIFTVNLKSGVVNVPVRNITYIEGRGKAQIINMSDKKEQITIYRSMETLEEELKDKGFIRIHKGYLVNYRHIARMENSLVELLGGEELPLSRRKTGAIKREFLSLLKSGGSVVV